MHFFRDCGVSAVLESSGMTYTLRFCARCFLALTKQLLFLEAPLIPLWPMRRLKGAFKGINTEVERDDDRV